MLSNLSFKPRKIVYCSSVDVYGNSAYDKEYDPSSFDVIDEKTSVKPNDKYGLFKLLSEFFVKDYCAKNGIAYEILRFGPIFGVGDLRTNFLIPHWISDAKEGKDLLLYGHPDMKRNLIFVDDVCFFVIKAINCKDNETINIVSDNNYSIKTIAKMIIEESGTGCSLIEQKLKRYNGKDRVFDSSKRLSLLGKEKFSFNKALSILFKNYQ